MAEDSFPLRVSLFIFMYDELQAQDHLRWEGERWKEKTKAAEREEHRSAALYRSLFVSQKCSSWKLKDQPLKSERKRVSSHKSLQPVKRDSVKYGQATATRNYGILVFPSNLTEGNIDCSELNSEFPFIAYITSYHKRSFYIFCADFGAKICGKQFKQGQTMYLLPKDR